MEKFTRKAESLYLIKPFQISMINVLGILLLMSGFIIIFIIEIIGLVDCIRGSILLKATQGIGNVFQE